MKRWIAAVLALCSAAVFCACGGNAAQDDTLYTGEYFKEFTLQERNEYILDIFYSTLAHLKTPKEYGLAALVYKLGFLEEVGDVKFDVISNEGDGDNSMALKEVPVSYALLLKAQEYEEKKGIDSGAAASKHGKKHAVKAQSVQDVITMVFRKDVPVDHASVDGAEYVEAEQVYVYDELSNPYQSYIDKGWELQYVNEVGDDGYQELVDKTDYMPFFTCIPLWYDKDGSIYDMYGDFLIKQEDPANRVKNGFELSELTEKAKGNARAFRSTIFVTYESPNITEKRGLETPIDAILIGKTKFRT